MNKPWIRLPVLLSCVLLASACASIDPVTGQKVRNMYLIEEDIQLGQDVMRDVVTEMEKAGVPMNRDAARVTQIQTMINRIAAVSHYPELPYEFILFHTNIVNAAAAPGGKILVFEGLYHPEEGIVHDEDELAAVIAHEIAHVNCRHTTRSLTRELPWNLILLGGGLAAELAGEDDLALALGGVFLVYQGLVLPKYSRTDEFEADRVGLMYMAQAGYDPRAAPRIWRRVHKSEGRMGVLQYLSTHPDHRDRARELEKLLPEAMDLYAEAVGGYPADYTPDPFRAQAVIRD